MVEDKSVMSFLWFVIMVLACHRITRLITRDEIPFIAVPRAAFVNRWSTYDPGLDGTVPDQRVSITGKPTNLFMRSWAYLAECDWCMALWVGAILVYVTDYLVGVGMPWLVWPAVSGGAALIAQREN